MDFKNKHSLGQNFLNNQGILNNIIKSVDVSKDDIIVEVGPGTGALTTYLKEIGVNVYAFEIDERTKPFLDKLANENLHVIYKDFLNVNLNDYVDNSKVIHIIANIPYYITTPIIDKIIKSNLNVKDMTLMVQDEVANRLASLPGSKDYGYFTVYINYYYKVNKLFKVDRYNFSPVPNVDSAVIQLVKREKREKPSNEDLFFKLIKDAFQFKRKNLRNNLKKYDLNKIDEVLHLYGHTLNSRAEEVSVEEFIQIANKITI